MLLERSETPDIFGLILKQQFESENPVYHAIERDDGWFDWHNTQKYFATSKDWSTNEQELLKHAESPVLDIGCGAGRHSLPLQNQGLDVSGLDISEGVIYVCKKRGLTKTILGSASNLPAFKKPFNTFLLLFNNFGILGTPSDTISMLQNLYHLGTSNARILLSYADVEATKNPFHLAYHERNRTAGRPIGQVTIRFRFSGYIGSWFDLWLPTKRQFLEAIKEAQWRVEKDLEEEGLHHVMLIK
jgi:SAM-dependent methyltransferase